MGYGISTWVIVYILWVKNGSSVLTHNTIMGYMTSFFKCKYKVHEYQFILPPVISCTVQQVCVCVWGGSVLSAKLALWHANKENANWRREKRKRQKSRTTASQAGER